jgi:flavin-binding protein dodecin
MNYDYTNMKVKVISVYASSSTSAIENAVNDALDKLQNVDNCIVEKIEPIYQNGSGLLRFVIVYREIKGK